MPSSPGAMLSFAPNAHGDLRCMPAPTGPGDLRRGDGRSAAPRRGWLSRSPAVSREPSQRGQGEHRVVGGVRQLPEVIPRRRSPHDAPIQRADPSDPQAAERYQFWSGRWGRSGQQSAPIPCHIPPVSLLRIATNMARYQQLSPRSSDESRMRGCPFSMERPLDAA